MGEELCHICNDKSTGKHYGAVSCDGCKDKRNACRSCRLQKCVMAGMKSNAIQNERDAIGKRKKTPVIDKEELFDQLVAAENLCQQLRSSVIKRTERATYDCRKNIPPEHQQTSSGASLNDVGKSIHQQLVLLVEWAKSLPQFASLSVTDQASLLKGTATSIITLGVAYRTVPLNSKDAICLANDRILSQSDAAQFGDMNCVVSRIVQQAVNPIRNLNVDLMEYVALKGILFFNPIVPDIEDRAAIENFRLTLIRTLKRRCAEKAIFALDDDASDCRTSLLLLLLPSLQSLAQQLKEDVQLARIFGLVNVDSLMIELILNDQKSPDDQLLQTSLSSPMESIKAELEV